MRSFEFKVVFGLAAAIFSAAPAAAQISVWTWAGANYPNISPSVADMVQIVGGDNHTHGRKADGTVWSWDSNTYGQLGDGSNVSYAGNPVQVTSLSSVGDISAGQFHVLAAKNDGTVWSWGYNYYGQLGNGTKTGSNVPVQVTGLASVTKVSGGYRFSLALRNDGTVWAWGRNDLGQLGNGTITDSTTPVQVSGLTNVIAISAGGTHALALKNDGTVWAWGDNWAGEAGKGLTSYVTTPGQVPGLTNITQIAAGWFCSHALRPDGEVIAWGSDPVEGTANASNQTQLRRVHNVVQIASAQYNHMALDSSGRAWYWGGNPQYTPQNRPLPVDGIAKVVGIAVGYGNHFAYRDEAKPWSNKVLMQNQTTNALSFLTIIGSSFTSSTPINPAFPANLAVGAMADFDGNGYDDIIAQNRTTRDVSLYLMQGTSVLGVNPLNNTPPANYRVVAATDIQNDGKPELVFQDMGTQQVYYSRIDLPTSIVDYQAISKPLAPGWIVVGSADMDGSSNKVKDLIVHNPTTRQISILVMGGNQNLTIQASVPLLPTLPPNWTVGGVGDYDGDGWPDILVQNTSTGQVAVLKVVNMQITGSYSISPIPLAGWTLVGPK